MPPLYVRCLLLSLSLLGCCATLAAQDVRISQGGRVDACDGVFLDAGGTSGNHSAPGQSQLLTLCPDGSSGATHVELIFTDFDIAGTMTIFNGADVSADTLILLTGAANGSSFVVRATAGNASGCLTIRFENDGVTTATGWRASIGCTVACQPIEAILVSATPAAQPDPTGYIDLCPGDPVTFTGRGNYPEDGDVYDQSDATSTFTWNFQDGTVLTGPSVTHRYEDAGGYIVQLIIEDDRGCRNSNRISQRVRVAPPPVFGTPSNLPTEICVGDDLPITLRAPGGSGNGITFTPAPQEFSFNTSQTFSELTFLPDGTGTEYSSPLLFSSFSTGQTLQDGAELVRICARMEHSYLGDLDIWIQCPNGNRLDLHTFDRTNNDVSDQLLGQGDENTTTPDPPGTYCWTATAERTMAQAVAFLNIGEDETMPEIDYAPEDDFSSLVGCDLNGEWSLFIRDNLAVDNGYIYEWSIEFENDVYPDQETFTVPITSFSFRQNAGLSYFSADSILVRTDNPGVRAVTVQTLDDYGCAYDTTVLIDILPPYDPACGSCPPLLDRPSLDTAICEGGDFTPNLVRAAPADTVVVWESTANGPFGNFLYPEADSAFSSPITVSNHFPAQIGDGMSEVIAVCVNLENTGDLSDITLVLNSPTGESITLLENFGGNGENLTQTCFSPTSTTPIGGAAPYTGTFRSVDDWAGTGGTDPNGTWTLRAWDGAGNDLGRFLSWSLALSYNVSPTYRWAPDDGNLSCTDCPNPVITPAAEATYTLDITTASGCTEQATVTIRLDALDITLNETVVQPGCEGDANGSIDLEVTGPDPNYNFRWSDGATTEDRSNLAAGDYRVTISNDAGCALVDSFTLLAPTPLTVSLDTVMNVGCAGDSDGQIMVSVANGNLPYTFTWDDPNIGNTEDAGSLAAGTYTLQVTDDRGCTGMVTATVTEPAPLTLSFTAFDVNCRDGSDGRAVAIPAGGNGNYTYAWQTGGSRDTIDNLTSGTYEVTVTDDRGCTTMGSVFVDQPATGLSATIDQTVTGCFGADANGALVTPAGGSLPYRYAWTNGETTAAAQSLPAGPATVTVTDAGGCAETYSLTVTEHPEVTANLLATSPSCNDRTDGQLGAVPSGGVGMTDSDYTFQWSTGQTGIVITNLPGDVRYAVTITDPIGCTGQVERFLPAPDPISFTVTETPVDCFGASTGGLAVTNITGPNAGDFDLRWNAAAGNGISPTVTGLAAGSNYVLRITDVNGCNTDTVLTVTQPNELLPNIAKVDIGCFGEVNGSITAIGTGGVGTYQYAWSTGSTDNQLSGLAAATYELTLTDGNGCENVSRTEITQPEPIMITATSDPALCAGEATGSVTVTGGGGRPPFLYNLGTRGFSRNNVFVGLAAAEYTAFVRDSAGCEIATQVNVNDGPVFSIELGPDTTITFGDSLRLSPRLVGGVGTVQYNWRGSYDGTLDCTDCPVPTSLPEYEIDYFLTVLDENGCSADDRVRVSVRKIREVAVPTGFTPNGDDSNDLLVVHGRPGTRVLNFAIFDRWGNLLFEDGDFEVNDLRRGWDGTSRGAAVNAGVYVYRLLIRYDDDSEETLAGETTLIR